MQRVRALLVFIVCCVLLGVAAAENSFHKIGELELPLAGISATLGSSNPVVPKGVTGGGVRIVVKSEAGVLSAGDVQRYLGGAFQIQGELSGPGLAHTITLPQDGVSSASDPFLLVFPALTASGDYTLSNLRIVVNGNTVLGISPSTVVVNVVDQVLITSVETKPLTLDEIQSRGIVLDSSSYLGYEFSVGLQLESKPVNITFPVVFDKSGVAVPQPLAPPADPTRGIDVPLPTIVPVLLTTEEGLALPQASLSDGTKTDIRIPSVLVIPGNVGYLKQFFSADLIVANGAPGSSNLVVHDVTGTIQLPAGADQVAGTADDPLSLPETTKGAQSATLPVLGSGEASQGTLKPGAQGQAEWSIRGDKEGFHYLNFDIKAVLEGLVAGPVKITGKASGGVLVRNPYFDMTFAVPSVVRKGEPFKLFVTVSNISQAIANDVNVALDASRMSGAHIVGDPKQSIATLRAGDAQTLTFTFQADRTGKIAATYLHLDTQNGSTGQLNFTLAVGERGITLSPDTLVLPTAVDDMPTSVVDAAMRVLGQAWSIANAPAGTVPVGVIRTSKTVVTQKALALAEAGLRISLGQPASDAVRDLVTDFYGGKSLDAGFDQLLRQTQAGKDFAAALGSYLSGAVGAAGGPLSYQDQYSSIAASGPDQISFAVANGATSAPVSIDLVDGMGRHTSGSGSSDIPGGVLLSLGSRAPVLGMVTAPANSPYALQLTGRETGAVDVAVTIPRGDGSLARAQGTGIPVVANRKLRVVLDLNNPDTVLLQEDTAGDGSFATQTALSAQTIAPQGAHLISATVIGPEVLDGASSFGTSLAMLFDRVVSSDSAATSNSYLIPDNAVQSAKPQLSGRIVFANLAQPEGPNVSTQVGVNGLADERGVIGPSGTVALQSRLKDPGAVVSGRVVNADGTPPNGAVVTYINQVPDPSCQYFMMADQRVGVAAVSLGSDGHYQFRYVRQDPCGNSFSIATKDPASGALRSVSDYVRSAGEQLVLDLSLIGRGSISGTVRDLNGKPVYGAKVVAVSVNDPQMGGSANTDGDGRYVIHDISVGAVAVTAGKGISLGKATGRIDRAGTTATLDVTLDGGSVSVSGTVSKLENRITTPVPGAVVIYRTATGDPDSPGIPVGVTKTAQDGTYSLSGMPVGDYLLEAELNTRDSVRVSGTTAAGDVLQRNLIISINPEGAGTVSGIVRLPDHSPVAGAVVAMDGRGVLTASDGSYQLTGVAVKPLVSQVVRATTRDGRRSGQVAVTVSEAGQAVKGADITLSGFGTAVFTVLDAAGKPIANQSVALLTNPNYPCGINAQNTDADGKVTFTGLPVGAVSVKAQRQGNGFIDVATAAAVISQDGATGYAILRFAGSGVVTGLVLNPDGSPSMGANLLLASNAYSADECSLVSQDSQRTQTDQTGHFRFSNVNVGRVAVRASQPFFPTSVGAQGALTKDGEQQDFKLQLVNTISGELSGTVYLPDGTTPAGSGVQVTADGLLPDVSVTTDAQGHYQFAKIFPEGTYTLTAMDPVTGGQAQQKIYLRANQDSAFSLRLLGRGSVRVRAVDGGNQPVSTAYVTVKETSFPNETFDGALDASNEGVVSFDNVTEGPLSVEVSDPFGRGGRTSATLPQGTASIDVKVQLTTTGAVQGHFYKADGSTPVPFGQVTLTASGRTIGQITTAGTGDVGSYSFDYVPAGQVRLEAQDPVTARTAVAVGTIEQQNQKITLDLTSEALGSVQGLVTSNGSPEPGAKVLVTSGRFSAVTVADASGRYLVTGVPEGVVVVTASLGDGFLSGSASAPLTGEGKELALDVALRSSGRVTGTVLNADGSTVSGLSLVTISVGGTGGGTQSTTSDTQGRFTFDRVPSGLATISVKLLAGIDEASASVTVAANDTTDVSVRLNGVGTLAGEALDSAGQPTEGTVTITGTGAFPYRFLVTAGVDGRFSLPEVLAGSFTASLQVKSASATLYGSTSGSITPGATTNIQVQVQPSGTITGTVLRPDGTTPAVGADIRLDLSAGGRVALQAQNDGSFVAYGVPLGAFTIHVADQITGGLVMVLGKSLESNGQTVNVGTLVLNNTALVVTGVTPADGATNVGVNQPIVVSFNQAVSSVQGISFASSKGAVSLTGSLSEDGKVATFTGKLPDSEQITVRVSTGMTDLFGRTLQVPFTAKFDTVDLTAPSVAGITPAGNAIQVDPGLQSITIHFSEPVRASDPSSLISVTGPTGPISGTTTFTDAKTAVFTLASPLVSNASYSVTVSGAVDLSGNLQARSYIASFATVDTVAPVLQMVQPESGQYVGTARPTIQVSATDALTGVVPSTWAMTVDGQKVTPNLPITTTYIPAGNLSDGQHTVLASVNDAAGNTGTLNANFYVDATAPSVPQFVNLSAGQVVRGAMTLSASATDSGSGMARIEVYVDGSVALNLYGPNFSDAYNTATLSDGPHSLAAKAFDQVGNASGLSSPMQVIVDNVPLSVTIDSPAANAAFKSQVTVTAALSKSVQRLDIALGQQVVSLTSAPYLTTFDVSGIAEGSQTITATAYDYAGNHASAAVGIVVDRTPPVAPDASKIDSEVPVNGVSQVYGAAGAVEALASVFITNTNNGATASQQARADGTFSLGISASVGDQLSIYAVDSAGNVGPATGVVVRALRTVSLPVELVDGNDYAYDIQQGGSLLNGGERRWPRAIFNGDGAANQGAELLDLVVEGQPMRFAGQQTGSVELGDRQVVTQQQDVGGLDVTRKIYVSKTGYSARYLELITNSTSAPITFDLQITSNLNDSPGIRVIKTSSGDAALDITHDDPDRWVVIDSESEQGPVSFVFDGSGGAQHVGKAQFQPLASDIGQLQYSWNHISLQPGATVAYLHFAVQENTRAAATAAAARLVQMPPEALEGLTRLELSEIQNFAPPMDGSSSISAINVSGSVSGTVLAGDGTTPVARASVHFRSTNPIYSSDLRAIADDSGNYGLKTADGQVIPVEPFSAYAVTPGGTKSATVNGEFPVATSATVQDIAFVGTSVVHGTLQRQDGTAVRNGTVTIDENGVSELATVDGSGHYIIPVVSPGQASVMGITQISSSCGGRQLTGSTSVSIPPGQTSTTIDVSIVSTGNLSGTFLYSSGNPVSGSRVSIWSPYSGNDCTYTDESGHFAFTDLPTGQSTVTASTLTASVTDSVNIMEGATTQEVLRLPGLGTVRVLATRADGTPLTDLFITVTASGKSQSGYSDANGWFSAFQVPVGSFAASASGPDGAMGAIGTIVNDGEVVTVNLRSIGGQVQGRVTAADNRTGIAGFTVVSFASNGNYQSGVLTQADGSYGPLQVSTQIATVKVFSGNCSENNCRYDTALSETTITYDTAGEILTANFAVPYSVVTGKVTYSDGTPVASPQVCASQLDDSGSYYTYYGISNDDGTFSIVSTLAGDYKLTVQDYRTTAYSVTPGHVDLSAPVNSNVVLHTGTITGTVTDASGNPLPHAQVVAVSSGKDVASWITSDDRGVYSSYMAQGPFYFQAHSWPSSSYGSASGTLDEGQTLTIDMSIPPEGTVVGTVYDVDGVTPYGGAQVTVKSFSNVGPAGVASTTAVSDQSGQYRADNVQAGNIEVQVSSPDRSLSGIGYGIVGPDQPVTVNAVLGNALRMPMSLPLNDTSLSCQGMISSQVHSYDYGALIVSGDHNDYSCSDYVETELNQQQYVFGPTVMANATLLRKVYASPNASFVRWLDTISNETSAPITMQVGYASTWRRLPFSVFQDAPVTKSYVLLNSDWWGAFADVFAGPDAPVPPAQISNADTLWLSAPTWSGDYTYTWNVTLQPGQKLSLLHFSVWTDTLGNTQTKVDSLRNLTDPYALYGLTADELSHIVNFKMQQLSEGL